MIIEKRKLSLLLFKKLFDSLATEAYPKKIERGEGSNFFVWTEFF